MHFLKYIRNLAVLQSSCSRPVGSAAELFCCSLAAKRVHSPFYGFVTRRTYYALLKLAVLQPSCVRLMNSTA